MNISRKSPAFSRLGQVCEKFSLIDYSKLPSASFEANRTARKDDMMTSHNVYVAGNIVASDDLIGINDISVKSI